MPNPDVPSDSRDPTEEILIPDQSSHSSVEFVLYENGLVRLDPAVRNHLQPLSEALAQSAQTKEQLKKDARTTRTAAVAGALLLGFTDGGNTAVAGNALLWTGAIGTVGFTAGSLLVGRRMNRIRQATGAVLDVWQQRQARRVGDWSDDLL